MTIPSESQALRAPVIILTPSRSGSTLLRFILDTHPELACPPETGVGGACRVLTQFFEVLDGTRNGLDPGYGAVTSEAEADIIALLESAYGRYLQKRGKRRWCDKSLDNIEHAYLMATLWPDAQFICLTRHCMDVIASGLEVCTWGLTGFGFGQFAGQFPGNNVAAIGAYWASTMGQILEFVAAHTGRCHLVRYEDLVSDPEQITAGLFNFLGERHIPGIARECLESPHETTGPGDEKIWFTREISSDSVGRGVQVPAELLPPPLLASVNEILPQLGYRIIDEGWKTATGPLDPRVLMPPENAPDDGNWSGTDTPTPQGMGALGPDKSDNGGLLPAVVEMITDRTERDIGRRLEVAALRWPELAGTTLGLAVTEGKQQWDASWYIPALAGPPSDFNAGDVSDEEIAGPPAEGTNVRATCLAAEALTWHRLLVGDANMAVEMRYGRLRWTDELVRTRLSSDDALAVAWLLGLSASSELRGDSLAEGMHQDPAPAAAIPADQGTQWQSSAESSESSESSALGLAAAR